MKIGLAQINTIVGDLRGNAEKILHGYRELVAAGAELVLTPELAVAGYPPRDLLFKSRFVADNEASLRRLAAEIGEVPALIGFVEKNSAERGRHFYNAAAWCEQGEVRHIVRKCLLPTYDVFDEDRYFEPARETGLVTWKGVRIGITICEDVWNHPSVPTRRHYEVDPVGQLAAAGVDLVLNLSASPWHSGKKHLREHLLAEVATRCGCPLVYCNLVGGNDELIFDGHSKVMAADGTLLAGLKGFSEELRVVDTAASAADIDPRYDQDDLADIHDALVLGLRDYAHKSGFRSALIGLSGGIDSAVVAALAKEAFGPENVIGVSLPSAISSQHSRDDARILAENLGIRFETLPIAGIVEAAGGALKDIFAGTALGVAEENIQARARGLLLMAVSNKFGALLLTTGNKSEVAVGYCTLYGDMAGGLAVISDLPKMQVYALARYINRAGEVIPENTITKPPSAELRPDQKDEDSLPPYPVLDDILRLYVEEGKVSDEIIAAGFDEQTVRDIVRKVDLNEYKRKQAAPGLKITPLAFGVGRRIPIVQKYVS
ncbi:NAD+ synthase [Ruficoccus amylovorans]|uniref:Glutamine-dependent NAD(+) synthetase n=1 Tax=Ruficoccus amylovorans TaxID=1804625 RepID=A0A842HBT2_9BACT|nr:NAD+ synthase [Ruficoccus amylovorans]MBC2593923.1 NAD+ synthase [Ruficoccus amylovorans]